MLFIKILQWSALSSSVLQFADWCDMRFNKQVDSPINKQRISTEEILLLLWKWKKMKKERVQSIHPLWVGIIKYSYNLVRVIIKVVVCFYSLGTVRTLLVYYNSLYSSWARLLLTAASSIWIATSKHEVGAFFVAVVFIWRAVYWSGSFVFRGVRVLVKRLTF